jgi:hypothetical protein
MFRSGVSKVEPVVRQAWLLTSRPQVSIFEGNSDDDLGRGAECDGKDEVCEEKEKRSARALHEGRMSEKGAYRCGSQPMREHSSSFLFQKWHKRLTQILI